MEEERGTGTPPRILIVEDDFLVARDLETSLVEAGMEVVGIASAADDAIRLAASERPTLVLMDIRLAGERDGIDAALEIARNTGARAIFATAHHDPETRARAQPARPIGWLSKPYSMEMAIATINAALRQLKWPNH